MPEGDGLGIEALRELRRTRRRNRFREVHWIDTLYQAYVAALLGGGAVVFAVASVPDETLDEAGVTAVLEHGPAAVGLVLALLVAVGMRSGVQGGPLNLEPATVAHELGAPLPRRVVLSSPALKQLRFLSFVGAVVGGTGGLMASHRLEGEPVAWLAAGAALGVVGTAAGQGAALAVSGRRLGRGPVASLTVLLVGWSSLDLATGSVTSPFSFAGNLALWPLEQDPTALVAFVLAGVLLALGMGSLDGVSTEAALRRSGLVSQLRFAATMQDLRTVVLLRRQLSRERPRSRPWIRVRGLRWLPPVWQRDLQGLMRQPAVRLARMVVLAVVAGLCAGVAWRGTTVGLLGAGLALYTAAQDAVEPLAQEIDHPTRWAALPGDPGRVLLHHLPVAFLIMVALTGIGAAAALALVPAEVVGALAPTVVLPIAAGATMSGALAASLASTHVGALVGAGPEMMGLIMVLRTGLPVALAVAPCAVLLAAGHDPDGLELEAVANASTWPLLAVLAAGLYVRSRRPSTV